MKKFIFILMVILSSTMYAQMGVERKFEVFSGGTPVSEGEVYSLMPLQQVAISSEGSFLLTLPKEQKMVKLIIKFKGISYPVITDIKLGVTEIYLDDIKPIRIILRDGKKFVNDKLVDVDINGNIVRLNEGKLILDDKVLSKILRTDKIKITVHSDYYKDTSIITSLDELLKGYFELQLTPNVIKIKVNDDENKTISNYIVKVEVPTGTKVYGKVAYLSTPELFERFENKNIDVIVEAKGYKSEKKSIDITKPQTLNFTLERKKITLIFELKDKKLIRKDIKVLDDGEEMFYKKSGNSVVVQEYYSEREHNLTILFEGYSFYKCSLRLTKDTTIVVPHLKKKKITVYFEYPHSMLRYIGDVIIQSKLKRYLRWNIIRKGKAIHKIEVLPGSYTFYSYPNAVVSVNGYPLSGLDFDLCSDYNYVVFKLFNGLIIRPKFRWDSVRYKDTTFTTNSNLFIPLPRAKKGIDTNWVKGEVSNMTFYNNGKPFFAELIDIASDTSSLIVFLDKQDFKKQAHAFFFDIDGHLYPVNDTSYRIVDRRFGLGYYQVYTDSMWYPVKDINDIFGLPMNIEIDSSYRLKEKIPNLSVLFIDIYDKSFNAHYPVFTIRALDELKRRINEVMANRIAYYANNPYEYLAFLSFEKLCKYLETQNRNYLDTINLYLEIYLNWRTPSNYYSDDDFIYRVSNFNRLITEFVPVLIPNPNKDTNKLSNQVDIRMLINLYNSVRPFSPTCYNYNNKLPTALANSIREFLKIRHDSVIYSTEEYNFIKFIYLYYSWKERKSTYSKDSVLRQLSVLASYNPDYLRLKKLIDKGSKICHRYTKRQVRKMIKKYGGDPGKVKIQRNGNDMDLIFLYGQNYGLGKYGFSQQDKVNVNAILKVAQQIHRTMPQVKVSYFIIGSSDGYPVISKIPISSNLEGFINRSFSVYSYQSKYKINDNINFLLNSISDFPRLDISLNDFVSNNLELALTRCLPGVSILEKNGISDYKIILIHTDERPGKRNPRYRYAKLVVRLKNFYAPQDPMVIDNTFMYGK